MSYARWSNSSWYAFYNCNGKLSLWYNIDKTIDWEYEDLIELMEQDPTKISIFIMELYKCTEAEAEEAMTYIKSYIEDYDPIEKEKYDREVEAMLAKWKETE
jgi:hypothetical protein